jgi:hypothetical protein
MMYHIESFMSVKTHLLNHYGGIQKAVSCAEQLIKKALESFS